MRLRRGQSIIETVIAAALISVAIIAALSLANHSQKQNSYARNLAQATTYATQGSDWMRTQRDSLGWATIASKAATDQVEGNAIYCLNTLVDTSSDFTDLSTGSCADSTYITNTFFTREMTINTDNESTGTLKITVRVTWLEQLERQATVETELTSWH